MTAGQKVSDHVLSFVDSQVTYIKDDEVLLQGLVFLTRLCREGAETVGGGDRVPAQFGTVVALNLASPVDLLPSACLKSAHRMTLRWPNRILLLNVSRISEDFASKQKAKVQ